MIQQTKIGLKIIERALDRFVGDDDRYQAGYDDGYDEGYEDAADEERKEREKLRGKKRAEKAEQKTALGIIKVRR